MTVQLLVDQQHHSAYSVKTSWWNLLQRRKLHHTYRNDLTSSPLWRICSIMWSQLPGFDLDRPAPVPLCREAPAGLPRTPRGPPRWPPPPGPVCSWPRLWEVTGGSLGPGGGWWVRGCWRLCCRTKGRGRATAEDGMCSRVEADEREVSPKLIRLTGAPRKRRTQQRKHRVRDRLSDTGQDR